MTKASHTAPRNPSRTAVPAAKSMQRRHRRAQQRDFPLHSRCEVCGIGENYLLLKIDNRVLCADCRSGGAIEWHHIAGRKSSHATIPVNRNVHLAVSRFIDQLPKPLKDFSPSNSPHGLTGFIIIHICYFIVFIAALINVSESKRQ